MRKKKYIAIIIPAYNEEKTICPVIKECLNYGDTIVVNDCSSDRTETLSKIYSSNVISHETNLGYDSALESGLKLAIKENYKIAITIDADGEHPLNLIPEFVNKINDGNSLVIGIRNRKNRFIETVFSIYTQAIWGLKDPLCGMKCYNLNVVNKIGRFNTYESIGTELSFRILKAGKDFDQINISVDKRNGHSRMGNNFMTSILILKSILRSFLLITK